MECINPLLTTTTTKTNDKMYFSNINKNDTLLMENDAKICALKKAFSTQSSSSSSQYTNWNQQHLMYRNCSCKHNYNDGDIEHCHLNTCASNLLLQGSDDPLIGHGANSVVIDDDHPMELRTLQLQQQQQLPTTTTTTTSINWSDIVKEKLKNKTQAKVQYAFQQQQEKLKNLEQLEFQQKKHLKLKLNPNKVKKPQTEKLITNKPAHENVKSWLKSIVDMQKNITPERPEVQPNKKEANEKNEEKNSINYNDLPYMGEITLDNSRPRRGRKPKKANICHLIYKNYGTIILGEPKISTCKNCVLENDAQILQPQNPSTSKLESLPLNLCLRDQQSQQQQQLKHKDIVKHKRSTIFIPPKKKCENASSNNSPSPSVEVSIGKFKFTGGVNPLLQKKKMLSVDSVGNYIYFDGNDNKMLHAGEQQMEQKLMKQPKTLKDAKILTTMESERLNCGTKRKSSRRSEQRERLEKSFKEQGFLIQTQQMQSSEGATYCKFRQLKKFTRYLFRNWKDYLPNELQQQQQQQQIITEEEQQQQKINLTSPIFLKTENTENAK